MMENAETISTEPEHCSDQARIGRPSTWQHHKLAEPRSRAQAFADSRYAAWDGLLLLSLTDTLSITETSLLAPSQTPADCEQK